MNYPVGLSVEEGKELILHAFPKPKVESVSLDHALGRVLAQDIIAKENIPPYSRSPYDGYAFRALDLKEASKEHPVTLEIIEEVPCGHVASKEIGPGQAIKILTGAPTPKGADTIEKFEVTEFTEKEVTFFAPVKEGSNVVPEGEDVTAGTVVLQKGTVISAGGCGVLAGLGVYEVPVYQKPRVGLISTGDELVSVDQPLSEGHLRNSSAYTIDGYLKQWGMETRQYGIAKDRVEEIADLVRQAAADNDVVITTGGVSVGDYDCMGRVMEYLNADILYWKTKMKPGSAFLAATYESAGILCLSGNPSAAAVALMIVARPALLKMAGRREYENEMLKVKFKQEFKKKSPMRRFVPGRLVIQDGEAYLLANSSQANGMISNLDGADLIGEVDAGSGAMKEGDTIRAYLIR